MTSSLSSLDFIASAGGMEETLWFMAQRSRTLQALRKDIHHVWDDEAAREINSRYLNPHETDSDRMAIGLREQNGHLKTAEQHLELANSLELQIDECAAVVEEKLRFAEQDMDGSYSNYDQYVHYNAEARSKFPVVQQLIGRANSACQ
ncbi:MAG TPA: hypothetical protein DC047_17915 [Blastocatellia bacterium]|nr:hypothetical protein [Blastocatellia bacterium]